MNVELITKTIGIGDYAGRGIDEIIVAIARLSSQKEGNELFDQPEKLLRHCLLNGHWSVFSTVNLGFMVTTSRAMGRELLRHWSLSPQEFSQRYASPSGAEPVICRKQSPSNRQSSTEAFDPDLGKWWEGITAQDAVTGSIDYSTALYNEMISKGVARECARMILPECTTTKLYLNGKVRDWITFLNVRLHKTAQKECREIALNIAGIMQQECPLICRMLGNFENAYEIPFLDQLILDKHKPKTNE